ncbi:MAG: SEC-C domain-containing protein [Actinomycetota bacterium]|nr:SEC-C domain-containing protein [Actinomycetota bacterium]
MSISDEDLRSTAGEVVGTGMMSVDAIAAALADRTGGEVPADRVERVLAAGWSFVEIDGGLAHVPSLVADTAWAVELDEASSSEGVVPFYPDLAPLARWMADVGELPLVDDAGSVIGSVRWSVSDRDGRTTDVLAGPDGWLGASGPGPVVVSVTAAGVRVAPATTPVPAPSDGQVEAIRSAFAAIAERLEVDMGRSEPVELRIAPIDDLAARALAGDRAPFVGTTVAPLPALLEAAGLEHRDDTVAEAGIEWGALRSWRVRERLMDEHGLDAEAAKTLFAVLAVTTMFVADEDPDALGVGEEERAAVALMVALALSHGPSADAFWAETVGRGVDAEVIGRFERGIAAGYTLGTATPIGLAWLRARCLEAGGDAAGAVAELEQALRDDTAHVPALVDLAGFAADRSEAAAAFAFLRRSGVTDHDHSHHDHAHGHANHDHAHDDADEQASLVEGHLLVEEVRWFAEHRPSAMAGRNERCPCGSGRKYKVCHLGRELHPLEDRAYWLVTKAERFLRRRHPGRVEELASMIADPVTSPRAHAALHGAAFVADLALHEGGVFAEFLAARAPLLPDDERRIGERWLDRKRSLFELERVTDDRIVLRDLITDEHVTVANLLRTGTLDEGRVIVGRPVPVDDEQRAFTGFLPVEAADVPLVRAAIVAGDPDGLAVALGQALAGGSTTR